MSDRPCPACGEDQTDGRHHHPISGVTHRHLPAVASGAKRRAVERRSRLRRQVMGRPAVAR
jgi:hypothetical protein